MTPAVYSFSSRFAFHAVALLGLSAMSSAGAQTIERIKLTDNELSCQQIYAETQQMDSVIQLAGPGLPVAPPAAVAAASFQPAMPLTAVQQAVLNHPNNANLTPEQKATLIAQTGMAEARGNAAVGAMYGGAPSAAAIYSAVGNDPGVQAAVARARASGMSEAQINATIGAGMQRSGLPPAPVSAGQAYAQAGGLAGMLGAGMSAQGGNGSNAAGLAGMFGALAGMAKPAAPAAALAAPAQAGAPASGGMGAQARARKDHLTSMFLARGCKLSDISK
ncbi:MAG: hypothetical protein Q7T70_11675 [Polaromonas sp.]|nr:hypothetical protein [Polaromonas sp.]